MLTEINGIKMAFTDEGRGLPMLFVHGFPLSRGAWAKQVGAFAPQYRLIAPDLRGFGESGATPGPVPMSRFAEDLHALIQHLGCGPVILAGHSMGGYVALAFAAAHPDLLRGLVLVGTRSGADSPEVAASRRASAETVRQAGIDSVVAAMAPKMLAASNADPAMALAVRAFMQPASPEGVIGALLGMAERPDAGAWLAGIRVPTLVITGADDTLILPKESEALAKAIPGARLALIPRAGHLVAFEQAETFNAALGDWLSRGSRASAPGPAHSTGLSLDPADPTAPTGDMT